MFSRIGVRSAPALVGLAGVVALLLAADTPAGAIAAFLGYAALAVLAPGTLVYRALRARPHTLVEDLTYGAVVGLVLELVAWAAYTATGVPGWLWTWPLAVFALFAAVPRLRRHWWVRGYTPAPPAWSWAVAAIVVGFTWYLAEVFLWRNPVVPTGEDQQQYIDLAFQLSLAGEATHRFPLHVPQVAGEVLHYHWFGFAHMAAASLVSGVDLAVVFFRLAVPALCALAVLAVAVTGWRLTRRPAVGAVAAALMFTVGEFGFENGIRQLFGTQTAFIVWGSPSMTYSWVLLLPMIAAAADRLGRRPGVPPLGRGAWVLLGALLLASTGAKASSIPVFGGAAGFALLVGVLRGRRWWRPAAGVLALALAAQGFATVVLFAFETHGVAVQPLSGLSPYVGSAGDWALVGAAFLLNMQLRLAGIVPLLWRRRGRLDGPVALLVGGALAGPALYLLLGHPGSSNQYFVRTAFAFGVLASALGAVEVWERARLGRAGGYALAAAALAAGGALVAVQWWRGPAGWDPDVPRDAVLPLLRWAALLGVLLLVAGVAWRLAGGRLRGRGGAVLLALLLAAGAPGLVNDARANRAAPNGGTNVNVPMPASRVAAARWLRDHSAPTDVLATNAHCRAVVDGWCDSRTFWLGAYAQRSVLIEGWAFAPRAVTLGISPFGPFWDQALFAANDAAITAPTAAGLADLRDRYGVRWLVVDRSAGPESPELAGLAPRRFDNGIVAVYHVE
ncbi:hypothetical protein GCM10010123_02790 [Pilimelia anulata]|uniref:Uncharacterized protein n=1 Tax=Pilimelia anulata TaxID=53371 RepID=A0A8J3AZC8_9ACTN|nr:hypothetical protein [Pilimelia anulata]GGJ76269.1 hypothetical protein GCM10010123_02790 [Pilimelia anulata]